MFKNSRSVIRFLSALFAILILPVAVPAGGSFGPEDSVAAPPTVETAFVYETVFNAAFLDSGQDIAVDAQGNAYVLAFSYDSNHDVELLKLGPDGTVLWDIVLHGSGLDYGTGLAVDDMGYIYVTGRTNSADFPIVNAMKDTIDGFTDAFVTKLSAQDGSIVFSTFFGGNRFDQAADIELDSSGNILIIGTTESTDLPLVNPIQDHLNTQYCFCSDAFVSRISNDGSQLLYSTYLGGGFDDEGVSIAADGNDNIYISGTTKSADFPTASPIQPVFGGGSRDVFVSRISSDGTTLEYGTFLGGEDWDRVNRLVVDEAGNAYLVGTTRSIGFPTTPGAFQEQFEGDVLGCGQPPYDPLRNCDDVFVTKVAADGSAWAYSTFLGGSYDEEGRGIALDSSGQVHIIGYTVSSDFPPFGMVSPTSIFVSQLSASGSELNYTIEIDSSSPNAGHGIAVDDAGDLYVTGAQNVPADIYVARISNQTPPPVDTLHVQGIRLRGVDMRSEGRYLIQGVVVAQDEDQEPVSAAEVTVQLTLPSGQSETLSGLTNARGRVVFEVSSEEIGLWELCVLNIARDGDTYDPSQNNETCESLVFPPTADFEGLTEGE